MKNLILLKLIQDLFALKSIFPPMKTQLSTGTQKDSGFTMIELMIVVLVIGILSAIAAPSWDAFVNRQRIRTVNSQLSQALQKAQLEAKKRKKNVEIKFDPTDPLEVVIGDISQNFDPTGEIKPGMIELVVKECQPKEGEDYCTTYTPYLDNSITFDYTGAVTENEEGKIPKLPFAITVSRSNGQKRCVFVQTLLGGMRTDEGEFNSGKGCP